MPLISTPSKNQIDIPLKYRNNVVNCHIRRIFIKPKLSADDPRLIRCSEGPFRTPLLISLILTEYLEWNMND